MLLWELKISHANKRILLPLLYFQLLMEQLVFFTVKPSSENPQLLPVTLNAAAVQPEPLAEDPETLSISCEVTFQHGTLRLNGTIGGKLLTLLIQELKRWTSYLPGPNLAGCRHHRHAQWLTWPSRKSPDGAERRPDVRSRLHLLGSQLQFCQTAVFHRRRTVPADETTRTRALR